MPRHQSGTVSRSGSNTVAGSAASDFGVFRSQILDCGVTLEGRDHSFVPHEAPNDYARHVNLDWGLLEAGAVLATLTTVLMTLAVMVGIVSV
jgi:hypothetical protein